MPLGPIVFLPGFCRTTSQSATGCDVVEHRRNIIGHRTCFQSHVAMLCSRTNQDSCSCGTDSQPHQLQSHGCGWARRYQAMRIHVRFQHGERRPSEFRPADPLALRGSSGATSRLHLCLNPWDLTPSSGAWHDKLLGELGLFCL